ncbi:SDR family oxidoreductase [Oceanicoccus sp. KOV_DT_Chl]|uniref:SDR family oxidoreductase n=1 Tax=Oceanicoccus sp. KOV_DT_Chl TaxID=1904639 RepID=UPI000C7D490A|nr:SDR family oxidoreductase [Oceanicoccus sp. KOV_DT_Chl]
MSVILVTGASTGIGQETALHMARKGHTVYGACRNPAGATELKEKIDAENLPVSIIKLDLVDPATIKTAVTEIMEKHGRIDALVNNAGIGGGRAVEETPLEEVREIFETNYFGNVSVLREVTPIMRKQNSGRIVTVGSLAGQVVMGCHAHYSASKWAMEGLSEALAMEMAEFNVKVSIIEPGVVLTPIWAKGSLPEGETPYRKTLDRLARFFMFGHTRPAMPDDVASAIAHAIESDKPHFRYPVGPDAVETVAAKNKVSNDEWMEINCLQGEEFNEKMAKLVGVDYYRGELNFPNAE